MKNFRISRVPADLHTVDRDKVSVLWCANLMDKPANLFPFDFRLKDIDNNCVELSDPSGFSVTRVRIA